jgi:hypothetical protein
MAGRARGGLGPWRADPPRRADIRTAIHRSDGLTSSTQLTPLFPASQSCADDHHGRSGTMDYSAFIRRIQRAYGRRVGDGDVEALALTLGMAGEIDTGIAAAVKGPARPRLLLGRNRFTARRRPPGRPAAMGSLRRKSC